MNCESLKFSEYSSDKLKLDKLRYYSEIVNMSGIQKVEVISLLRKLLRVSMNMSNYNFRDYSKRRIMYEFKCNKDNNDYEKSVEKYKWGCQQYEVLRRQSIISQLYPEEGSVINQLK